MPPQPVQHVFDRVQCVALGLRVACAAPARAATLHAWSITSAPAYHQSQYSGAALTQSVAPLGAPPTA